MNKLESNYEMKEISIDKRNVELFKRMENARQLRNKQVEGIRAALLRGEHFDSPIVINRKAGDSKEKTYEVIDGNHRIAAILEAVNMQPDLQVKVNFVVYDKLNEEEKRDIFHRWNMGLKQTMEDFLSTHKDEFQIWMYMKESFPCNVVMYTPSGKYGEYLKFRTLMKAYGRRAYPGGSRLKEAIESEIARIRNYTRNDYAQLSEFIVDFMGVFGKPGAVNTYCRMNPFSTLMKIYFDNVKEIGREEMIDRMRNVQGDAFILQFSNAIDGESTKQIYDRCLALMNKGKSKMLCVDKTQLVHVPQEKVNA